MVINRDKTAAFSGHRSFKINNGMQSLFSEMDDPADTLSARIEHAVRQLCEKGYDTFLCGMAEGFDLMAGEAVLKLAGEFPSIRLLAIIPYPGQASSFDHETREAYDMVLSGAEAQTTICNRYSHDCFHRRNNFLTDNSSALICYYNGSKGGTAYTVRRAMQQGAEIINLYR